MNPGRIAAVPSAEMKPHSEPVEVTKVVNAQFSDKNGQIYGFLASLHPLVLFVTVAAIITFFTQFIFLFNLV